ncbi:hypothetical protein LOD99_14369 [Oopsacas minuta]|uniref:MDN2-binding protein C-terminal domain-containing protein n=1 Tax=Oopsacas minuta TaxID=111878 RepID=A0AAV7KFG3_9METZ|nr:hypothetical protein LOD99_14369 [Oopsacas minuta]
MCENVVTRGFILLILGEAKSESEIEFFSKCLKVISDKLCKVISHTTQLYLSFVPQDISPYRQDDPIALVWELVSDADECCTHLCDKLQCTESKGEIVTSFSLTQLTSMLHGLLDQGIQELGNGVLLDLILVISSSGVSQLIEGEEALGLYGALKRVVWQNGHITAVHCVQIDRDLLISPAVTTSVVMLQDEKLDCIDENIYWQGVYLSEFDPFDNSGREKQIKHLCVSRQPESISEEKNSSLRKKKVSQKSKEASPFMILVLKEMIDGNFPFYLLQNKRLKLYSPDKEGQLALKDLRVRLSSVSGSREDGNEGVALLGLISCHLDKPLLTDTWYEYIIGKQSHWINSVKIEMLATPNYCLPPQHAGPGEALYVWQFKHNYTIPDSVLEDSIRLQGEEELPEVDSSPLPKELVIPELNGEQLLTVCSIWNKLLQLPTPTDPDNISEELNSKVDEILLDMPVPSRIRISLYTEDSHTQTDTVEDIEETLEHKSLCAVDKYSQLLNESMKCPMKRLGGLSPPPMTRSSCSKIDVDSLLKCFDSEGHVVEDLDEEPIPTELKTKLMKERLFNHISEGEELDQSCAQYSWNRYPVKNETQGLMSYESSSNKSKLVRSLFTSKSKTDYDDGDDDAIPEPLNFKNFNISTKKSDKSLCDVKMKSTSKAHSKSSKAKVKLRPNKSTTDTKVKKNSGNELSKDKELRSLLERAVVRALKGENLTREHPQFKSAYTQLFNVCKCFLTGLQVDTAKAKVEQLAISNAKQVVDLQTKS